MDLESSLAFNVVTSKCFWEIWYAIYINHESLYSCSSGSLVSDPLNNVLNLGDGQVGVSRESEVENKLFAWLQIKQANQSNTSWGAFFFQVCITTYLLD